MFFGPEPSSSLVLRSFAKKFVEGESGCDSPKNEDPTYEIAMIQAKEALALMKKESEEKARNRKQKRKKVYSEMSANGN